MNIAQLLTLAFLVEALWETLKMTWQNGKLQIDRIGALALGVGLSLVSGANLFGALGLSMGHPIIGQIFTGVLVSRGSNWLHDLLTTMGSVAQSKTPTDTPGA